MSERPVVLVLTQRIDPHADFVIPQLAKRDVDVIRFDTADFPMRSTLRAVTDRVGWTGSLHVDGRILDWQRITSAWYRRPREFEFEGDMSDVERKFARTETLAALGGLLRSVGALWVNHPEKVVSAEYKPYQLSEAARCGFEIPRTLLTNDPDAVREFHDLCGGEVVYKTLSIGFVGTEEGTRAIYTSKVTAEDFDQIAQVRRVPCLFQELISRDVDVRIIVVGQRLFAVTIRVPPDVLDWRTDYKSLSYEMHELPPDVARAVFSLTTRLGLAYAAIDMILTRDGRYVFLEVNPSGQWVWLEKATGAPMSLALIDLLVSGTRISATA